jgi:ERCC4-type nuclease
MIRIVIDTREQTPWAFDPARAEAHVGTLQTGDYALDGDDSFAIERKSMDDFLGTISTGWERFRRELERMEGWAAKVIIVEGDYEQTVFNEYGGELIPPTHRHWMLSPQFVEKRIAQLTMMGVAVLFARDAHLGAGLALAILAERKMQNETNQIRDLIDQKLQAGDACGG